MTRYCDVHRLVRLGSPPHRPDGECRLCTLEAEQASNVRKAECDCTWGEGNQENCPQHDPDNDWCHAYAEPLVVGADEHIPFHHYTSESRAWVEASARPRAVVDEHPGYHAVPRALVKNVRHIRYIGDVDEDADGDFEYERRAGEAHDALPDEMRKWLADAHHRLNNVQGERKYAQDAWLKVGLIGGDLLHDLRGVLARVDWQLTRNYTFLGGETGPRWYAEPTRRGGNRIRGMRERVHQPFFDTLSAGIGMSTVQNQVQLFQTPNPNTEDVED